VTDQPCPFCEIVAGRAPAEIVEEWPEAIAIVPLNPVVEGHVLVIPREHVRDFTDYPKVSAATMLCAAELVAGMGSYNLITSKGRPATQSVFHLHLHLVPRAENDGLALPWYSGHSRTTRKARTPEAQR
jgi:histidine triad (HIT) family protein